MSRSENFADARLFPENANVSPNIAAGSGAALVGMILAAATNVAVLDITGGVLTGIGILFAGITAGVQKRKIVKGYQDEIAAGKTQMQEVLESKLRGYVRTIKGRINENFDELDALLENEKSQISDFKERWEKITTRLNELDKSLD